jgi:Family of unknown function (DUF6131)
VVVGLIVPISVLTYIGGILIVVGLVLLVLGRTGRAVGGRKVWF